MNADRRSRTRLSGMGTDGLRFLAAGAGNTVLTFLAYQLLLFILAPQPAYALTWLLGLGIVVVLYPSHVFRGGRTDTVGRVKLALVYVAVFFLGLGTLHALSNTSLSPRLAIVFVMVVTTLANFLLGRLVLKGGSSSGIGS